MALNTTLTAIIARCRERSDMVNSQFVTDTELTAWINLSGTELYDLLVGAYGNDYFLKSVTFNTVANKSSYTFASDISGASDFYKLRGMDIVLSGTYSITLKPFSLNQRGIFQNPVWAGTFYGRSFSYRFDGAAIVLAPVPLGVATLRMWYTPVFTALVNGSDSLDGVDGWEAYIIADVCRMIMNKQQMDASPFIAEKAALMERIKEMAEMRDSGEPMRITETSQESLAYFYGIGRWGY